MLRRFALMIPTFLGITLLTFAVAQLAPGDPFSLDTEHAGPSSDSVAQQRANAGLDAPVPLQFVRWLGHVVRFDFGTSLIDHRPVTEKLFEALPRTALIAGLALVLGFGFAVPLGVVLATQRKKRWSRWLEAALLFAWSIPSFWLAVLLLLIFASPRYLNLLPVQGLGDGGFILPVICLAWPTLVVASRQVRASMEQALAQDYVKAARARGIPERSVVWRHALRNSLLPLVTLVGLHLPHLVGGSVVIERIFGIPGMGLLAFDSIGTRDYPTVMGATTVIAIFTMLSMLIVDLLYGVIDPRIRMARQ